MHPYLLLCMTLEVKVKVRNKSLTVLVDVVHVWHTDCHWCVGNYDGFGSLILPSSKM